MSLKSLLSLLADSSVCLSLSNLRYKLLLQSGERVMQMASVFHTINHGVRTVHKEQ